MTTPEKIKTPCEWADITLELDKAEQMGHQTVLQFAKVGQMLIEKMGDMPIREFVQHAGQHIPRLSRSTCHNYMTLAKNRQLLEQKQPDSQRAALAMIAAANAPKAISAPERTVATPQQQPEPEPEQKEPEPLPGGAIAALNAACDALNKTEQKAMQKVGQKMMAAIAEQFWKQVDEEVAKRFPTERERLEEARQKATEALREATEREVTFRKLQQGIEPLLSMDEFKLIRGCLHADRVPEDLKPRFDKAFVAFNKVSPYFERLQKAMDRAEKQSERSKAMWEARKAA